MSQITQDTVVSRSGPPIWLDVPANRVFTPAWVTRAIAGRWPGCVVSRVEEDPIHIGTTNHHRVRLTYSQGEGPASLFIKAQSRLGKRLLLGALGLITPETRFLGSAEKVPMEGPEIYAVGINALTLDSIIVMEDLKLRGAIPNHVVTNPMSVEQVYRGIDQLARLHGKYWNAPPTNIRGVQPWKQNFGWVLLALLGGIKGTPKLKTYGETEMFPAELHGWSRCVWLTQRAIDLSHEGPQTLLHGDTHPGNTYNVPSGEVGFVDWQCVHTGSWSRDTGYFIMSALEVEERRTHEKELLRYYLDALGRAGGTPPSWEDTWNAYRNCPAYGLVAWLSTLAGDDYQPDSVNLRYIKRFGAAYTDLDTGRLLRGRG